MTNAAGIVYNRGQCAKSGYSVTGAAANALNIPRPPVLAAVFEERYLRSADISASIDGRTTYPDHISASPKKLFAILGKRGETFSGSLTVPSGEHVVQVHLSSATDGFDQTKQRELNLLPGRNASGVSRSGNGSEKNLGSAFPDSLRSILVTLLGSAVSAAIDFAVQEFLRSRKAA